MKPIRALDLIDRTIFQPNRRQLSSPGTPAIESEQILLDMQAELDALPKAPFTEAANGRARIETYTVIAVVFFLCLFPLVQATYALERRLGRSD